MDLAFLQTWVTDNAETSNSETDAMKASTLFYAVLFTLAAAPVLFWLVLAAGFAGYETDWTGIQEEVGPVPLSNSQVPIVRLVDRRRALGGDTKRLYWDEGEGPVLAEDRIKPLMDSIPKELYDRLTSTRDVPANLYPPFRESTGTTYESIYDVWTIVVSLNPDILVMSVYERPIGPHPNLPLTWNMFSGDETRRAYINERIDRVERTDLGLLAGSMAPWSEEMYVISNDPNIGSQRLEFSNGQAKVMLPTGKLMLSRQGDDVDVTRN